MMATHVRPDGTNEGDNISMHGANCFYFYSATEH